MPLSKTSKRFLNTARESDSITSLSSQEKTFPNIQPELPLVQLEATPSSSIASYTGEEANPHLVTTSFQAAVQRDEVSHGPLLLQSEEPLFPQPFLIKPVRQIPHQPRCSIQLPLSSHFQLQCPAGMTFSSSFLVFNL